MKHENRYALGKWMKRWIYLWVILGMLALILTAFIPTMLKARAASGDWTTYMADNGRSGYNPNETVINPSTAPLLKLKWTHTTAGTISTQPVEANSLIYWGSWDAGNEHATSLSNAHVWTNQLGTTTDTSCNPASVGVASISTVPPTNARSMLFAAGWNANLSPSHPPTQKMISP